MWPGRACGMWGFGLGWARFGAGGALPGVAVPLPAFTALYSYVGARFGTCFACPPRYDGEIRGRFLGPGGFSLPLARGSRGAHARGRLSVSGGPSDAAL
eukprot:6143798-Prymnesium_polylepis.4